MKVRIKNVDVMYTAILNIKKEKRSKPGMVLYKNIKVVCVSCDLELIEKLKLN